MHIAVFLPYRFCKSLQNFRRRFGHMPKKQAAVSFSAAGTLDE
jgi:hypothetical protein